MDISNYLAGKIIDHMRGTDWGHISGLWLSAHTADPTLVTATALANEVGTAVSGAPGSGQYNRASITLAAHGGTKHTQNTALNQITMPPSGTTFVVSWLGVWDAQTGGNILWRFPLTGTNIEALVTASSDLFTTVAPHGLTTDDRVEVTVGNFGTMPPGIVDGTIYYVLASGLTTTAFKLSDLSGNTSAGHLVDPTADGAVMVRKLTPQSFAPSNIIQAQPGGVTLDL